MARLVPRLLIEEETLASEKYDFFAIKRRISARGDSVTACGKKHRRGMGQTTLQAKHDSGVPACDQSAIKQQA